MSELKAYKGFKIGDRVTIKEMELAYDTKHPIQPGMVGTIKAFPPKIWKRKGPLHDSLPYFVYIEFDERYDDVHKNHIRGGVNMCNIIRA
jgi:hypothetical protein